MRTMREDGVRKVLAGLTTADEVISITIGDVTEGVTYQTEKLRRRPFCRAARTARWRRMCAVKWKPENRLRKRCSYGGSITEPFTRRLPTVWERSSSI